MFARGLNTIQALVRPTVSGPARAFSTRTAQVNSTQQASIPGAVALFFGAVVVNEALNAAIGGATSLRDTAPTQRVNDHQTAVDLAANLAKLR